MPAELLGHRRPCSAAAKAIEHNFSRPTRRIDNTFEKLFWFLCRIAGVFLSLRIHRKNVGPDVVEDYAFTFMQVILDPRFSASFGITHSPHFFELLQPLL